MRRSTILVLCALCVCSSAATGAGAARDRRGPFDGLAAGRRPSLAHAPVQAAPGLVRADRELQLEPRLGVPSFLWAGEEGRLDPALRARGPVHPVAAARSHLERYAPLYRLGPAEARGAKVRSVHDVGRGPVLVSFVQELDGIEVFRDEIRLAMDRSGDLIAVSGYLTALDLLGRTFDLRAEDALVAALEDLTGHPFGARDLKPLPGPPRAGYALFALDESAEAAAGVKATGPPGAKRVWYRLIEGLEPAWSLVIAVGTLDGTESLSYGYVISATDGRLLARQSFTRSESYTYRVWADPADLVPFDGPQGTDPSPHPTATPDGYQPPFVPPLLVALESGPLSTGDPWLPPAASQTRGNNVDAYADLASPDGFSSGDLRASTTSAGTFDRVYDVDLPPDASGAQRQAAVTQLFYTNNWLHDWFYDSGFDEAAGNAQISNYGRGGAEGDVLLAEGQDYSGVNNANMSTPPDGFSPRMQMYVFTGASGQAVEVNSPPAIAGTLQAGAAQFGPADFDLTDDVVLVNDGVGIGSDACEQPFVNAGSIAGRIALIDRGTCSFIIKVQSAEAAGAVGVLVANNVAGTPITMGGTGTVGIPSLMITLDDGSDIKANLGVGVNVRMQRESVVNRDGTLDNSIVAHEWGHYISNRLVGNAAGLNTQQSGGLGEGWGDFHAILMAVREEDAAVATNSDWDGAYAMSGYPESAPGSNSYYWSIRRTPLSTSFAINPLTFKHIQDGVALPTTAPLQFGQSGASNSEVHNTGEIWANMLWECYAALLRDTLGASPRLTFAEAQQRMKDYLVAGYKMTPNSPTFVEARDAILAAAAGSDPVDLELFWQAFAKRGLGVGAVAPDRFSTTNDGVVESFSTGGDLRLLGADLSDDVATDCLPDGDLDANETGTLTVTLLNTGGSSLGATTGSVSTASPFVSFPAGTALAFTPSNPFGTAVAEIPVTLSGMVSIEEADFQILFDDPDLISAGPLAGSAAFRINSDSVPAVSAFDDVESDSPAWSAGFGPGASAGQTFGRVRAGTLQHRWLGPDNGSISDIVLLSPPLEVSASGSFGFTFSHRHVFESSGGTHYDGAVLEISTNGGSSWSDIGGSASPGYGGTIASGGGNPIQGRQAFVGTSAAYPLLQTVDVSLGTAYQGQTVRVRLRIGTDVFVGASGWEVDDFSFTGIDNTPFPVIVPHEPLCDADGDAFVDALDCAPGDDQLWSLPGAVTDLTASGAVSATFAWSPPAAGGGSGAITYDLVRSAGATDWSAAACLESGTASTAGADAAVPPVIYYYLVGARNGCGRAIAPDSDGTDRAVTACLP